MGCFLCCLLYLTKEKAGETFLIFLCSSDVLSILQNLLSVFIALNVKEDPIVPFLAFDVFTSDFRPTRLEGYLTSFSSINWSLCG